MNTEDRKYIGDILRAEGNRRIARIEPGDDPVIRDSLVAAAQRCDDLAHDLQRLADPDPEQARREEADARASGMFTVLVGVAAAYVRECQAGTSPVSSIDGAINCALDGLQENLADLLGGS